ncbi:MAG TPA: FAD-binding oxidoreductase [Candidatus Acidoferrum sp.]|nr:FAD-binding oxidoreductase [Candidatus Acidoferrum sp.]
MPSTLSIEQRFAEILGTQNVHLAAEKDRVVGILPKLILEPETEPQLAAALAFASENNLSVIPRGGATKLHWGNPPKSADLILSTARLDKIIEHAASDLTVTVEAGCTQRTLQEALAKRGQRLALDPLFPNRATIGGILSTNDSGALRLRFGGLRDLIIGVTLALPDGTLASSGGKVVKNVAGYDLPKLATGAFGTLGVITRAVFRLHPVPWMSTTLTCANADPSQAQNLFAKILDSQLACSAFQARVLDGKKLDTSIDILFEGTQQGIDAQLSHLKSLAAPAIFEAAIGNVWQAREELLSHSAQLDSFNAIFKVSAIPADAIPALKNLRNVASPQTNFQAVVQATGLGTILLTGEKKEVHRLAIVFRERMERAGGSLVALGPALVSEGFDAWGNPGDAVSVMRAIKHQLDPKSTLNPGRFIGGI